MRHRLRAWLLCAVFLPGAAPARAPEKLAYTIDPARSKVELTVYREGAFKVFAHDHDIAAEKVSGVVQLDPAAIEQSSVSLTIQAQSLRVLDPKSSDKERRQIEDTMQSAQVLDAARYPEIGFRSISVSGGHSAGEETELTLSGQLSLHGVAKMIALPVRVHWAARELRVEGETTVLQSDYGIAPIRIGGGAVKVSFHMIASR